MTKFKEKKNCRELRACVSPLMGSVPLEMAKALAWAAESFSTLRRRLRGLRLISPENILFLLYCLA